MRSSRQIMFHRFCLLCLILSCRFAFGRLPVDVSPINTFEEYDGLISAKFSGVHNIVYLHRSFYVLSKNKVSSLQIISTDDQGGEYKIEEVINWAAPETTNFNCKRKTTDATSCSNFIQIFAPKDASGREFIVCGTHSSDPKCRMYMKQGNSFKKNPRKNDFSGKSICPYYPKDTGASLYTGGDLYAATFEDLLGRKPVIYRHAIASSHENLEREKKHDTWLQNAWFVKFVETSLKVYVLFKETAVEDNSGLTYTRVGQMCKLDSGGDHVLRKQFTSFAKARLNCSFPGNPPFYFNEIAAASDFYQMPGDPTKRILFAAMNTPTNSIWGSAICAYTEQDIEHTLRQPYLERVTGEQGASYWLEKQSDQAVTDALSTCEYDDSGKTVLSVENLQFIREHPLKSQSVPSWSKDERNRIPLFMKLHAGYQFSAITVDPAAGSTTQYLVTILGTTDGKILKIIPALTGSMANAHFIGEMNAYDEKECGTENDRRVRDIKIDDGSGYILVAFASCVVSVPMCPLSHLTCKRACIAAQDPYCAWDGDKCTTVLRSSRFEQDVLGGNVDDFEPCAVEPPIVVPKENPGENGAETLNPRNRSTNITNPAATHDVTQEKTTKADPVALASSFSIQWFSLVIGLAIAIVLIVLAVVLYRCWRRRSRSGKYSDTEEKLSTKSSNHSSELKRNSYGQRQDRPVSNHTSRLHSKRSESSVEEDEAFLDDRSDGNSNSFDKKSRRKRELSSNRKSNASSYRREDSTEQVPPYHGINRQTSRESNDSGLNGEIVVDATHPPSPQNPGMHRTMSATAAPKRPRDLQRQLSLHIPSNHSAPIIGYHHNLTPMVGYMPQNPMEINMPPQQYPPNTPIQQPHFDPSGAPTWHPSPAKNSKSMSGQHQTTSLDRKMLRAGGYPRPQHGAPHDAQQQSQSRNYADTLPSHGMDEQRGPGRKRYPSESGVGNHRPAPFMASKPSTYLPIQEEGSNMQDTPSQFPSTAQQRPAGRIRPNQLPLSGSKDGHFPHPNSNTTPMTEQPPPLFVASPTQAPPGHIRRNHSEVPLTFPPQQHHDLPHPHSAPTIYQKGVGSKSNPTTPDVDPNHNSFFRDQVDPNHIRKRNASGKSTTPTSNKEFSDHPDVIQPAATRQAVEVTYLTTTESKDPAV